jgi:hypothetical protein
MTRLSVWLVGALSAVFFAAYLDNLINQPTRDELEYNKPRPWPIFMVTTWLSHGFRQLADLLTPPAWRMLEVVEAVTAEWPAQRVAIRLSPNGVFNDVGSPNFREQFTAALRALDRFDLAFVHIMPPPFFPGGLV